MPSGSRTVGGMAASTSTAGSQPSPAAAESQSKGSSLESWNSSTPGSSRGWGTSRTVQVPSPAVGETPAAEQANQGTATSGRLAVRTVRVCRAGPLNCKGMRWSRGSSVNAPPRRRATSCLSRRNSKGPVQAQLNSILPAPEAAIDVLRYSSQEFRLPQMGRPSIIYRGSWGWGSRPTLAGRGRTEGGGRTTEGARLSAGSPPRGEPGTGPRRRNPALRLFRGTPSRMTPAGG